MALPVLELFALAVGFFHPYFFTPLILTEMTVV